jgi:(p)ppGpp synthase/HD superfamily hydrolase
MTQPGYSDRINHALAFAAKHQDQQVRRGVRSPYSTQPANVALILTRYGRDDTTVMAAILSEVVSDFVRDGYTDEMLRQRIVDKFGADVLATALAVAERRHDDDGLELSSPERRQDLLARLASADERARWVAAANALHHTGTLLADLRRTVDPRAVWSRYAAGRAATVDWYQQLHDRLRDVGFGAAIMSELAVTVDEISQRPD